MEKTTAIITVTNLADIVELADAYGVELDDQQRMPCIAGHNGDIPTMRFDSITQSFYCTDPNCRLHGNVIDLVRDVENVDVLDAIQIVADEVGLDEASVNGNLPDREEVRVLACLRYASRFYARHMDAALPYLESRGISRDTAERYLVGASPGKDDLKEALQAEGFTLDTIRAAGLLNQYDEDFFQDRLVVPIRVNGLVLGFYGRALNDDNLVTHLNMGSERLIKTSAPFNWDARREEVIVVEGILDALSLIDKGYHNAVAVFGTQGLASEKYQPILGESSIKTICLCYDGDEVGFKATKRDASALEDLGYEVRIADIDQMDPNEFMLKHEPEVFHERLYEAVPPIQWEIDQLDSQWSPEDKIQHLDGVMRRCKKLKPLQQAATIERLADALGFTKKQVRDHIAALPDETEPEAHLLDLSNCQSIHPALDVIEDTVLISVPQGRMDPETGSIEWVPYVITSERDFFPLDAMELHKRGFYTSSQSMADEPRYRAETIKAFLDGDLEGDLSRAFWKVHSLLAEYVDFPDGNTYVFLTAWIIGTYLYPIFNYYPYIHFTGTKNVGKSKTMKLMSCICFNGTMSVSITPASQFRIIEAFRPTLFMDETEDLKDKAASDRRAVLLGGYEAGSSVIRTEKDKDNYRAKRMGNYGPRAFASIEGLEDTLASRTVQITMQRSYDDAIKQKEVNLRDPAFQAIRDDLFLTAMTEGIRVKEIYETIVRPDSVEFGDREFNLVKPLLAICEATGTDQIVASLIKFANTSYRQKIAEYNTSAPENVLLAYLLEIVAQDGWFRSDEIHAGFVKHIKDTGFDLNMSVTKAFMGGLVKKLGLVSETRRSPDRTCTLYHIRLEVLSKVAANYQVI